MKRIRTFYVPRYSLTANIIGVLIICMISMLIIGCKLHGTDIYETVVSSCALLILLWCYFSYILFNRFRFDNGIIKWEWPRINLTEVGDAISNSNFDFNGISFDLGGHEGCLGVIMGIIASILVIITIIVLAYMGIEIGTFVFMIIAIPMYWIFRMSARMVIVNAGKCNGVISQSILIGLKYALFYSVIMGSVFYMVNGLLSKNS